MGTINDYADFAFWQEGFKISDEVVDGTTSTLRYFGYVNRLGHWHIMRKDFATPVNYRFTKGKANYSTNWGLRESLTYELFDETFK